MRRLLRLVAFSALAAFILTPYLPLVVWSFAFRWTFPDLLPAEWSLRPWLYLVSPAAQVGPALRDSLLLGVIVTLLAALIGLPAGRALGLYRFPGKTLVEFIILAPVIVPGLAVVLGMHVVFIRLGLADTWPGVVLAHLIPTTPYMVMLMASVFANYDVQFEQQARVLGASPWRTFRYITMPAILPGLAVSSLFVFLLSWSQYVLTLIIGGGTIITLPMLLFSFARSGDNAITAALSLVFIAPSLFLLAATARFLQGLGMRN
jgi:putative spermidine/putrescine transport system permease protein